LKEVEVLCRDGESMVDEEMVKADKEMVINPIDQCPGIPIPIRSQLSHGVVSRDVGDTEGEGEFECGGSSGVNGEGGGVREKSQFNECRDFVREERTEDVGDTGSIWWVHVKDGAGAGAVIAVAVSDAAVEVVRGEPGDDLLSGESEAVDLPFEVLSEERDFELGLREVVDVDVPNDPMDGLIGAVKGERETNPVILDGLRGEDRVCTGAEGDDGCVGGGPRCWDGRGSRFVE
jgi:hypothetical protein